jgi:hypothetical protein
MIFAAGQKTQTRVDDMERDAPEMSRTDLAILSIASLAFGLALIIRGVWPHGG